VTKYNDHNKEGKQPISVVAPIPVEKPVVKKQVEEKAKKQKVVSLVERNFKSTDDVLLQLKSTVVKHIRNSLPGNSLVTSSKPHTKSMGVKMLEHLEGVDGVLKRSLSRSKKVNKDKDIELKKYLMRVKNRDSNEFLDKYAITKSYVQNGGIWLKGSLLSSWPNGWDRKPYPYDSIDLVWKKVENFHINESGQ
jgi:hypothetical protein